ncbi:MAG: ABC transporter ATP-binding protein/permease [Defluviitaleaceae bacterium]|nr:ABC transporter ATP-binding protein/permease [Defluviitaleaceae bacterium]
MGGIRRGPGGFTKKDNAKDFGRAMRQLVAYLGKHRWVIGLVVLLAIISAGLGVLAPRFLGAATDEIFSGVMAMTAGTGGINFTAIGRIMLQLMLIHGASIAFNYIQGYIMAGVSMRIMYQLRNELSQKIHRLPLQYFDKNPPGDVLSRISNDTDTLSNTLNQGLTQLVMSFTAVVGIIVMMLTISPLLTLVSLLTLPFTFGAMTFMVKKSQKYFVAQQASLGKINGHIEEMFSNHAVVKAFNGEKASEEAFSKHNDELYKSNWKANFLSGLMMPITFFISNLGYVAVVVIGGAMAVAGNMTVGGIQAFIQYNRQFGQPVAQLAGVASTLQQTAAAAERVFEFLHEAEESPEHPNPVATGKATGQVVFDNITFGYDPEKPVIRDFNASVEPGQKIAIVGQTGAGKTTIVKLLMRFYDVDAGTISVDGSDIRLYTRGGLRSLFGMVLQETWLFNGTISDNIRYGNLAATDEQMRQAAKAAQADHFIRALPEGYDMMINEEADNISAGQKQLLTIARTILADPQILILDEATSNVDTRTELMIQKAMDNLMEGRTCFIIAHRLSTIRSADLILVMEKGDIVEQGTHEELLNKGGVYRALYNSQFDVA